MTTFEQRLKDTLADTYDIERELGGGGMSRVFVAIDRSLGRKVVIKLLSPELIADVNRGRFRREIQVAAQLQHPHIVPLLSAGEHEDLVWYTMPFIAGESLRSAVEKKGPMAVTDVVRVLYHVGEALDYAHSEGVVHRDIKAANILRSGTYALVTDFGVAKALNASMAGAGMTQTGTAIGTPAYMAPEQLSGDPAADHRIDIYATGLLAYELLNGRSPFAATTPAKVLLAVLSQEPQPLTEVRPDVPRSLSELIMRCLSKEPDDRPATARVMLNALDAFSTSSGEIRTMEHKVPRVAPTIPTAVSGFTGPDAVPDTTAPVSQRVTTDQIPVSATPALAPTLAIRVPTEAGKIEVEAPTYVPPKKDRTKMIAGVVGILVLMTTGAFLLSQRTANQSANDAASPSNAAVLAAESAALVQRPPATAAESAAAAAAIAQPGAATIDSQATQDSLKRARAAAAKLAAAKADSLRIADSVKRASVRSDSLRRAQDPMRIKARAAAAGLMANPGARKSFTDGATHKGGLLGSRTKGDLQTQIDALQPFLKGSGLTYEQFKDVVKASGITLFDQFGRMVPDSLQRVAGLGR
jgi:eukaryotic-like serine/threonine-protein kinase